MPENVSKVLCLWELDPELGMHVMRSAGQEDTYSLVSQYPAIPPPQTGKHSEHRCVPKSPN